MPDTLDSPMRLARQQSADLEIVSTIETTRLEDIGFP